MRSTIPASSVIWGERGSRRDPSVSGEVALENLKAALGGEQHEIDSPYPAFLVHATSQLDTTAMRSFVWTMEAEKTHALPSKRPWMDQGRLDFFVCTLCGYTARTQEADPCPASNFVWDRFERIR